MRPRGEIRQALGTAAQQLARERRDALVPGFTWRELAQRATWGDETGVAFVQAKRTVHNMVRAGELTPIGQVQMPHARRPMLVLVPALPGERSAPQEGSLGAALAQAIRGWSMR